jgi:hypothetical protein
MSKAIVPAAALMDSVSNVSLKIQGLGKVGAMYPLKTGRG